MIWTGNIEQYKSKQQIQITMQGILTILAWPSACICKNVVAKQLTTLYGLIASLSSKNIGVSICRNMAITA